MGKNCKELSSYKIDNSEKKNILNICWFFYILLFPIYLLPSGGLQIADFFIVAVFLLSFSKIAGVIKKSQIVKFFFYFLVYIVTINFFWAIVYLDITIFKNNLFYIFNFIIFCFCASNVNNIKFWRLTLYTVLISILLQFFLIPFGKTHYRTLIYFNNPNQLGYWALLVTSLLYIILRKLKYSYKYQLLLLSGAFFSLLSLSRAAIVSTVLVVIFGLVSSSLKKTILLALIISAIIIYNNTDLFTNLNIIEKTTRRFEVRKGDESPAGRGYDRIYIYPNYLFFGAGEGRYDRFAKSFFPGEIHSSIGTVIFSYGLIGFILFCLFIIKLIRRNRMKINFILIPIFLYSLTHMGLRFSLFWVVLAFIGGYSKAHEKKDSLRYRLSS